MKTLKQSLSSLLIALLAVWILPTCCQSNLSAAPIQGCDSGCSGCSSGNCGIRPGGLLRGRGAACNCSGGNQHVRCPGCEQSFPEEYCQVKVEKTEVEKTCFEVDFKTICIPKVVLPWQQKRGCSCGNRTCRGGCDRIGGSIRLSSNSGCDGTGGCNGSCGGCDGGGGGQCCGQCQKSNCTPCKAAKCDPNAPNLCCPSSTCAEARSVKILKKKKYKCPGCKCKWEVMKPELPELPPASSVDSPGTDSEPADAQPADSLPADNLPADDLPLQEQPVPDAIKDGNPQSYTPDVNGYYSLNQPTNNTAAIRQAGLVQVAQPPITRAPRPMPQTSPRTAPNQQRRRAQTLGQLVDRKSRGTDRTANGNTNGAVRR